MVEGAQRALNHVLTFCCGLQPQVYSKHHCPMQTLKVFAYGTLKPGEAYYDRYCAGKVIAAQEAIAFGQLFDLPMGYPAMVVGERPVYGIVLSFTDPAVLDALDDLEDYSPDRPPHQNEYNREQIEVFSLDRLPLGTAWAYLMDLEFVRQSGGILVASGRWTGKIAEC